MELTQPEHQFLDALLAGSHPALAVLREQLASASVERREFSGVGFFTHFAVPSNAPRLPVRRWVLSDVGITHPALQNGGGALLFVEDGALTMLEAYVYGSETWPKRDDGFEVAYLKRGPKLAGGGYQLETTAARDEAWVTGEYADAEHHAARHDRGNR
jgi:hypothetical protein